MNDDNIDGGPAALVNTSATNPIFVHSLWRCASTYLFNAFRRSPGGYWAYQEPIHEIAIPAAGNSSLLLKHVSANMAGALRHPVMEKPYFQELYEIHACWRHKISKSIVYDQYFESECTPELFSYVDALLSNAKGRPVIQECRTASRIGALRRRFGGFHIYAWRNPRDQWWSFKITDYFDAAIQLILNAMPHPEVIERVRTEIGFLEFHDEDIENELHFFSNQKIRADHSYLAFFILWALSRKEGEANAHLCLNIDRLSESAEYREFVGYELAKNRVSGLDFSDCRAHRGYYSTAENDWFLRIEERARELIESSVWPKVESDDALDLRNVNVKFPSKSKSVSEIKEDLKRSRQIALRLQDNLWRMALGRREDLKRKDAEHVSAVAVLKGSIRNDFERANALEILLQQRIDGLARREQELGTELLAVRQQAAEATAEHVIQRNELVRQHADEIGRGRLQLEEILRTLARREQELAAQLLDIQQRMARETADQARQHAEREQRLGEQLLSAQQELRLLERDRAQRELTLTLQATEQELRRQEQGARHSEQLHGLRQEHSEREHTLNLRLQAMEQELWRRERAQYAAQERSHEQLQAERAAGEARQLELHHLQVEIARMRGSLPFRLAAPFRVLKSRHSGSVAPQLGRSPEQPQVVERPESTSGADTRPTASECHPTKPLSMAGDQPPRATMPTPFNKPRNLETLLQYQGRHFVEHAYLALLNRQPDPAGFTYYVQRLRLGTPKIQILSEIYASAEARKADVELPGLRKAIKRRALRRLPVIGTIVRIFEKPDGYSSFETQLGVIEQQVVLLGEQAELHATQLGTVVERLATLIDNYGTLTHSVDVPTTPPQIGDVADLTPPATSRSILARPISFDQAPPADVIKELAEVLINSEEAQYLSIHR